MSSDSHLGNARARAVLALILSVPVPLAGVLIAGWGQMGVSGQVLWAGLKLWTVFFPLLWILVIERRSLSWSPMRHGGAGVGILSGLAFAALAGGLIWGLRDWILGSGQFAESLKEVGLGGKSIFIAGALYWGVLNSLLEEYFWRWFVQENLSRSMGPGRSWRACWLSAALFSIHHLVACWKIMAPGPALAATFGVFLAGWKWSILRERYRSIWPGYLSHAIIDIPVFAIGYHLLFGAA